MTILPSAKLTCVRNRMFMTNFQQPFDFSLYSLKSAFLIVYFHGSNHPIRNDQGEGLPWAIEVITETPKEDKKAWRNQNTIT